MPTCVLQESVEDKGMGVEFVFSLDMIPTAV